MLPARRYFGNNLSQEDTEAQKLIKLILAADKYSLRNVVDGCAYRLSCIITCENVVEILIISDLLKTELLKRECFNMIIGNRRDPNVEKGYKSLRQSHPDLVIQICDYMMEKDTIEKNTYKEFHLY